MKTAKGRAHPASEAAGQLSSLSEMLEALSRLELPRLDHVIFGSAPLAARGIIEAPSDLDVLCRGAAWDAVRRLAHPHTPSCRGVDIVSLWDGRLTFGQRWAIGDFDTDELIDSAEFLGKHPFAKLEYVVAYKRIAGREKDLVHLKALAESEGIAE